MSLTREEIVHLAKLANLNLTDEEIEKFSKQLSETVQYVENLDELDTSKVNPTASTTKLRDVFFEDGMPSTRTFTPEEATKNAKNKKNNLFVVKRIL